MKLKAPTFSLSQIASPTFDELALLVGTTLITPAGIPASCANLAKAKAESGVSDGGFLWV